MSTTYFIAGTVFFIGYCLYQYTKWRSKRNKEYDKAEKDLKKAVDDHDTNDLLDAIRRMRKNK